ncbi:MAG: nucleotidyltransferase [Planctomycetes bacterium]|nr:nucleotidyltransferase [Planctomycetota bacterium]
MDLLDELSELCSELNRRGVDFALCGGLAMAVYAFPRSTLDIDIMIESTSLDVAKDVAKELGFDIDAGLMKFKKGGIQIYRLAKVFPDSPDSLPLDLLLVTPMIERVWNGRQRVQWERGELTVISPDGLIELKTLRGSGQDQDDIKHLKEIIDED